MNTSDAIEEIWAILCDLPSPRDAARALAGAHVMLLEADGAATIEAAETRLAESSKAVLDIFRERAGVPTAQ